MRKSLAIFLLMAVAAIPAPQVAGASAITFDAPTINVAQEPFDQTGYFDVTIFQTGGGNNLYQFQVDLLLSQGSSSVSFINADLSTNLSPPDARYVFNGNSGDQSNDVLPYFSATEAENYDVPNTNFGFPLSSTPLGLMRVEYDVPANTAIGSYALTLNQTPYDNNVENGDFVNTTSYSNSDFFMPSAINGAINVVPEPSSVVMMVLGAIGFLGLGWRRARRAS